MSKPTNQPIRRRHLPRWSMRTMFVGITIVCVVIGYVVPRAEEQRQAVAELEAAAEVGHCLWKFVYFRKGDEFEHDGIAILYDYQWDVQDDDPMLTYLESYLENGDSPPAPEWLRELIGIDYLADVVCVDGRGSRIRDDDLRHLRHFKKLDALYLSECENITNVGLEQLTRLGTLAELKLSDNDLTMLPPEIGRLTKLEILHLDYNKLIRLPPEIGKLTNLEHLDLQYNPICDADLEHLKSLKNLKVLHLQGTNVTKKGVANLHRSLPNCDIACF